MNQNNGHTSSKILYRIGCTKHTCRFEDMLENYMFRGLDTNGLEIYFFESTKSPCLNFEIKYILIKNIK